MSPPPTLLKEPIAFPCPAKRTSCLKGSVSTLGWRVSVKLFLLSPLPEAHNSLEMALADYGAQEEACCGRF